MTLGCIQLRSGRVPEDNLAVLQTLVREAAAGGADYILTPEMTNLVEQSKRALLDRIHPMKADPFLAACRELARQENVWLHLGSMAFRAEDGDKAVNRAVVISPGGDLVATYDKIHMFDVDLANGESWRESALYQPGHRAVRVQTSKALFGLSICYDLRFPHLFRDHAKAGVDILTTPAAFTRQTGAAHWHILQRARAIENGAFVMAAAQGGHHEDGRDTYGHSLIIDPWGRIVAELDHDKPGVLLAAIDLSAVAEARGRIPSLTNERDYAPVLETGA